MLAMWITRSTLESPRIRLEPLAVHHAPDLAQAADWELFRFTPQAPKDLTPEAFEADIAKVNALADVVAFAIIPKAGAHANRAIGRTTYMEIKPDHRGVEIGRTWFARDYHGTYVNPEIKLLMLEHAFERLTPTAIRVQLTTGGTNLHSQHAIAKLGAVREGTLRKHRIVPGGPNPGDPKIQRDTVFFSILDDEWPKVKASLQVRVSQTQ
jgi:ribosomal-protein-alanine N-acetyltransferase